MGIRHALRMTRDTATITAALAETVQGGLFDDPSGMPIASPWSDPGALGRILFDDVFGVEDLPVTSRTSAMRIPAVARGRNLLVSTISRFPLVAFGGNPLLDPTVAPLPTQPSWPNRTTDGTSAALRLTWTVDDLIFHGWSLWWKSELAAGTRFPLAMERVNWDQWRVDDDTRRILINEQPVDQDRCVLIPGLHEGILNFGTDALRDARNLYAIVRERLENPSPNLDLHQTGGKQLSTAERDDLIDVWSAARKKRKGGVGYSSEHIDVRELGGGGEQLMIEARNAASLDLARVIGVSAGLLDATVPKASLNYETATGRNQEFVDRDVALYMTPITARLSMNDIVPQGTFMGFDVKAFTANQPTQQPTTPEPTQQPAPPAIPMES